MTPLSERTLRYQGIVPPDALVACKCTVIGVGAIGRQAALQLAAMGVGELVLIDHDTVETHNLGPQGYRVVDLGFAKVDATGSACEQLNPELEIVKYAGRFTRSQAVTEIVFCCVDSISTRSLIWKSVKHAVDLFIDARMASESLRVLTATLMTGAQYELTLFPESEAEPEPCTARSTIYCANIAAGMMVAQLARRLRGLSIDGDLSLNLLASELIAG